MVRRSDAFSDPAPPSKLKALALAQKAASRVTAAATARMATYNGATTTNMHRKAQPSLLKLYLAKT